MLLQGGDCERMVLLGVVCLQGLRLVGVVPTCIQSASPKNRKVLKSLIIVVIALVHVKVLGLGTLWLVRSVL